MAVGGEWWRKWWGGWESILTQEVYAKVGAGDSHWTDQRIDDLVRQVILTEEARKETNMQFIRDQLGESRERGPADTEAHKCEMEKVG